MYQRRQPGTIGLALWGAALVALAAASSAAQAPSPLPEVSEMPAAFQSPLETPGQPYRPWLDGARGMELTDAWDQEPLLLAPPPSQRDGVFQKVIGVATWLPDSGAGRLGITELELSTVFGLPLPTRESPLLITPAFAVRYLDGPETPDLPPRLFDAAVEFRWLRPLSERWVADVAISPGVYSDFQQGGGDAFRLTGHGIAIWKYSPVATWVFGAAYLDRRDVRVLPVGGLVYRPNDEWSFELLIPRPRIARRVWGLGYSPWSEYWAYVAGEFGGGQWAIERESGDRDTVTLRDYRLSLGLERKMPGGFNGHCEVGYVFGRAVEYKSPTPDFQPDATVMVRVGASY